MPPPVKVSSLGPVHASIDSKMSSVSCKRADEMDTAISVGAAARAISGTTWPKRKPRAMMESGTRCTRNNPVHDVSLEQEQTAQLSQRSRRALPMSSPGQGEQEPVQHASTRHARKFQTPHTMRKASLATGPRVQKGSMFGLKQQRVEDAQDSPRKRDTAGHGGKRLSKPGEFTHEEIVERESMLGRKVCKEFPASSTGKSLGFFLGTIGGWAGITDTFKILYDDGDEEVLTYDETRQLVRASDLWEDCGNYSHYAAQLSKVAKPLAATSRAAGPVAREIVGTTRLSSTTKSKAFKRSKLDNDDRAMSRARKAAPTNSGKKDLDRGAKSRVVTCPRTLSPSANGDMNSPAAMKELVRTSPQPLQHLSVGTRVCASLEMSVTPPLSPKRSSPLPHASVKSDYEGRAEMFTEPRSTPRKHPGPSMSAVSIAGAVVPTRSSTAAAKVAEYATGPGESKTAHASASIIQSPALSVSGASARTTLSLPDSQGAERTKMVDSPEKLVFVSPFQQEFGEDDRGRAVSAGQGSRATSIMRKRLRDAGKGKWPNQDDRKGKRRKGEGEGAQDRKEDGAGGPVNRSRPRKKERERDLTSGDARPIPRQLMGHECDRRFLEHIHRQFDVLQLVGSGTYGEVYECWDRSNKRRAAIKRLIPGINNALGCQCYVEEARIIKMLAGCPNVVNLLPSPPLAPGGHLCLGDESALVLTYSEHDCPKKILRELSKDKKKVRAYMHELLIALLNVHAAGLAHNDIKLSNILYQLETRSCLLVDFGLACRWSDDNGDGCGAKDKDRVREKEGHFTHTQHHVLNGKSVPTSRVVGGGKEAMHVSKAMAKAKEPRRHGTKGFRAPEVVLGSTVQTSAVCLLLSCSFFFPVPSPLSLQ